MDDALALGPQLPSLSYQWQRLRWRWAASPLVAGCLVYPVHAQEGDTHPASGAPPGAAALPTVTVIDNAQAQRRFDSAASHSLLDIDGFAATTPLVHLSELLAGQPGVVATDRGNYAQDLQIAVRGFGARSTFGVRGVRLLVDGIPATMPD